MTPFFCVSCETHMVRTQGNRCPVCSDTPAPVVVPPLALDPRPVRGAVAVDEQTGGGE